MPYAMYLRKSRADDPHEAIEDVLKSIRLSKRYLDNYII